MSNKYHDLRNVSPGSYKWKVKVRVVRFWRGISRQGETFKNFNLLLLDDKVFIYNLYKTLTRNNMKFCYLLDTCLFLRVM